MAKLYRVKGSSKAKLYRILWNGIAFGESEIRATSKKEAKDMAEDGKDKNFGIMDTTDWEVTDVEEIS